MLFAQHFFDGTPDGHLGPQAGQRRQGGIEVLDAQIAIQGENAVSRVVDDLGQGIALDAQGLRDDLAVPDQASDRPIESQDGQDAAG